MNVMFQLVADVVCPLFLLFEQSLTSLRIKCFQPWTLQNEHGWNIHHEGKRPRR